MHASFRTLPKELAPTLALSQALVSTLNGSRTREPNEVVTFYTSANVMGCCKLGWLLHKMESTCGSMGDHVWVD